MSHYFDFGSTPQQSRPRYNGKTMRDYKEKRSYSFQPSICGHLRRATFADDPSVVCSVRPVSRNFPCAPVPWAFQLPNRTAVHATSALARSVRDKDNPSVVSALAWHPLGGHLVTGSGGTPGYFLVWSAVTVSFMTAQVSHFKGGVSALRWSPDGRILISGDTSGEIGVWSEPLANVRSNSEAHSDAITGLSFSPDGEKFVSSSSDGNVRVWDFFSTKEEIVLHAHGGEVKSVDWHGIHCIIAAGTQDNALRMWDPRTGESICVMYGAHMAGVERVAWQGRRASGSSPTQSSLLLMSTARDATAKVWDIRSMKKPLSVLRLDREGNTCAWHPFVSSLVACGTQDGTLSFWDIEASRNADGDVNVPLAVLVCAHEGPIRDMEWHPMGHVIATAGHDKWTKFWSHPRPGDALLDRFHYAMHSEEVKAEMQETMSGSVPRWRNQIPHRGVNRLHEVLAAANSSSDEEKLAANRFSSL